MLHGRCHLNPQPTTAMPDAIKQKNYRILKLSIRNIKRIKAVDILPNGNVITIGGRNDQGKTSVIDSIPYALAGQDSVCERPVRDGESKGEIDIDIGGFIITKTFSPTGPKLKIRTADGAPIASPQALLDDLAASNLIYNPMQLISMKKDKLWEILRQLTGLDFTELNQKRETVYRERTATNRELVQKRGRLTGLPHHPDAPATETSIQSLVEEQRKARSANAQNKTARDETDRIKKQCEDAVTGIYKTTQDIADLEAVLAKNRESLSQQKSTAEQLDTQYQESKATTDALTDIDETEIETRISNADGINGKVRDNVARASLETEITALVKQEATQTASIEALDTDKEDSLKNAKWPLPGLSFNESGVLLDSGNGPVPFEQAGMASKIKASIAIGLALNPKLRVILIRDGSLLDDDSMAIVAKMAEELDAQIWVEVCHGIDKASVVIEDGHLLEV